MNNSSNIIENYDADRDRWIAWEGPEVEGRLCGIPSLFVTDLASIPVESIPHMHIFICNIAISPEYDWETWIDRALSLGKLITIECEIDKVSLIPDHIFDKVIVMACLNSISAKNVLRLKPQDMVRLGRYKCLVFNVNCGQKPKFNNYKDDVEWTGE